MFKVLKSNKRKIAFFVAIPLATLAVLGAFLAVRNNISNAVRAADFNPGRIIDDEIFYNKNAMNIQQIQDFLDRQVGDCDTWGTGSSGYGKLTNAQYAQQIKGWAGPPYVCINNYHENPTTHETSYEKGGGAFSGGISAAQIIYNAAQEHGINPQVLLVMLKKESVGPITSDNWPLKSQYKYAMGYACPDSGANYTAACESSKGGFYNQVMLAAWQFNYYKEHRNDYRYKIGWNDIQYSPDPTCGTKRVNIENVATLSLYIYTPYVPNDAALANYPGTSSCGAYGNRNFFMFFNEWFGDTYFKEKAALPVKSNVMIAENSQLALSTNSQTVVDIPNNNDSAGQKLQIWSSNGTEAQKFTFESTGDGFYTIRSSKGLVVDLDNSDIHNGTPIKLWFSNGSCAQKWSLVKKDNGKYKILSSCSGNKAIDVSNGEISKSGTKIQLWDDNGTQAQEWEIKDTAVTADSKVVLSTNSQTAVDIPSNNDSAGQKLQIWSSNGTEAQKFTFESTGDGFYTIRSSKGLVVDLDNSDIHNGTPIKLWFSNGSCAQKWSLVKKDNGKYKILSSCSGNKAIDVSNGEISKSGTKIQLWDDNGTQAQEWEIKK